MCARSRPSTSAPAPRPVAWALLMLPLLGACATASGDAAFGPDRPGVTPGPDLTPAGVLVTEMGYGVLLEAGHHHQVVGQGVVRVGIVDGLELRFGPGSVVTAAPQAEEPTERGDVTVGVKARLTRGGTVVPAAALAFLLQGEGSRAMGLGVLRPGGVLAARWGVPAAVDVVGSFEFHTVPGAPGGRVLVGGASVERPLGETLGLAVGWSVTSPEDRAGGAGHGLDLSMAWTPLPHVQLDVAGSVGLGDPAGAHTVGIGLARRW